MVITLLSWLYISFSCLLWGSAMLRCIAGTVMLRPGTRDTPIVFVLLLGFAGITLVASVLSFFLPLGTWTFQLILLFFNVAFTFLKPVRTQLRNLKQQMSVSHPVAVFLLVAGLTMILVMSTWTIAHPDTMTYHAQTIQWIEKYRAVPGLANLHIRYGYQGLWYVACAVFSFRVLHLDALTFVNSTILTWFLFFVTQRIDRSLAPAGNKLQGFLWLLLFVVSMLSYTEIRLTATSASPDFIATILVWAAFFLLMQKKSLEQRYTDWALIIAFSAFGITLKLSVLPVLLMIPYAAYRLMRARQIRPLIISLVIAAMALGCYTARNIVSSGYLVFPAPSPDLVRVDWKVDRVQTALERDYIKAYARMPVSHAPAPIALTLGMKFTEWIPKWWNHQSWIDRLTIFFAVLSVFALAGPLTQRRTWENDMAAALVISFIGLVFWFSQAPDPRFGFGFIISFPAVVLTMLLTGSPKLTALLSRRIVVMASLIVGLGVATYTVYRIKNFFTTRQLVEPIGIKKIATKTIECNGMKFQLPADGIECGTIDVPCIYGDCENFMPRGSSVTDGFRERTH